MSVRKLVVQIPCLNEEQTIRQTIADVPRRVPGVDVVEVLIIDDGSTDETLRAAREAGADHVLSFPQNRGLAAAFAAGLEHAVALGADIIVHTDADNQYAGSSIPDLLKPILDQQADLVVGVRPIEQIEHFSWAKKRLQRLGSWVVRAVSKTDVADVTSGFRAYSREAAMRLTVISEFTFTHETLIQAGRTGIAVAQVPIATNPQTRPSRLFSSIPQYIRRSLAAIFRIYALYQPFRVFTGIGLVLFSGGVLLGIRYLYFVQIGQGRGHVQSVILAGVLLMLGLQAAVVGLLADLIGANRKLLQESLYRIRRLEMAARSAPEDDRCAPG